jgi:SAM-dependent methyltransferase
MTSEYTFDPKCRVYARPGRAEFSYSDSDEVEDRLWRIVSGARDRTTASKELMAGITDWPSLYHLSPYRTNLLRPFTELIRGSVLEVGSGCGVLTRFLGEQSASITAVEGSMRRARIAAERCTGLSNVRVYCDNFQDFSSEQEFQLITCVGVIEYSPIYFSGPDPFGGMLRRLAAYVAPDGFILIAIENRLGLKYFAGAPEDHTGQPFQSIEDRYSPSTPATLGKREWLECLERAGLELVSTWYPFPDYKIPRLILSAAAFQEKWLNVGSLLRSFQAGQRAGTFSEAMVWPMLVENGLAEDLANSFVLLARRSGAAGPAWTAPHLLYHYSADRLPEYAVAMSISGCEGDGRVSRRRLFTLEPAPSPYCHRVMDERYIPGELYSEGLHRILKFDGWKLEDLARWAEPWVQYLRTSTSSSGESPLLPLEFLDCIPSNLVLGEDGTLRAFDLEFVAKEPPTLAYAVFRGLFVALMRSGVCAKPAEAFPKGVVEAAFSIMSLLGLPLSSDEREALVREEARLQEVVRGVPFEQAMSEIRVPSLEFRGERDAALATEQRPLEIQLFWTNSLGQNFRESDSCRMRTPDSDLRRTVHLHIPTRLPRTAQFRIDLSNRPGLARLFGMRLLGERGNTVWEWDGTPATLYRTAKYDMEILAVPESGQVVLRFSGDDPRLILPISESVLESLGSGSEFEVDFSWVGTITP